MATANIEIVLLLTISMSFHWEGQLICHVYSRASINTSKSQRQTAYQHGPINPDVCTANGKKCLSRIAECLFLMFFGSTVGVTQENRRVQHGIKGNQVAAGSILDHFLAIL